MSDETGKGSDKAPLYRFVQSRRWVTVWFVFAVLLGIYYISAPIDLIGFFQLDPEQNNLLKTCTRALLSSAVVFIYWICLISFTSRELLFKRYICDTTYFLGFIFTLCSLMLGFLKFGGISLNPEEDASNVEFKSLIAFAGAALLTTMFGIFLRVLHRHIFNAPHSSLEQRLDAVGLSFEGAANRIENSTEKFATGIDGTGGAIVDKLTAVSDSLTTLRSKATSDIEALISMIENLNNTTKNFNEIATKQFQDWQGAQKKHGDILTEQTALFVQELNRANEESKAFRGRSIKGLSTAIDALTIKLKDFGVAVESTPNPSGFASRIDRLAQVLEQREARESQNILLRMINFIFGAR